VFVTYGVVTALTAAMLIFSATLDFTRYEQVVVVMTNGRVPLSWMNMLGAFKTAGALGIVIGLTVPWIGAAAAIGVVLFFICAVLAHLRVGDKGFGLAVVFGLSGVATLLLNLAVS
jgi:hypothetical protein